LAIWRGYCSADVRGGPIDSGHYLAEEAPQTVLAALAGFFR
jgi:haloacetate dehalogenase